MRNQESLSEVNGRLLWSICFLAWRLPWLALSLLGSRLRIITFQTNVI